MHRSSLLISSTKTSGPCTCCGAVRAGCQWAVAPRVQVPSHHDRWPKGKLRATCRATWVCAQPAQLGRNLGAYRRNQHNLGATWGVIGATRRAPVRSRAIPSAIPISACAAAPLVIAGLSALSRTSDHYNAASSCGILTSVGYAHYSTALGWTYVHAYVRVTEHANLRVTKLHFYSPSQSSQ